MLYLFRLPFWLPKPFEPTAISLRSPKSPSTFFWYFRSPRLSKSKALLTISTASPNSPSSPKSSGACFSSSLAFSIASNHACIRLRKSLLMEFLVFSAHFWVFSSRVSLHLLIVKFLSFDISSNLNFGSSAGFFGFKISFLFCSMKSIF